jgi:acetyltransferase
MQPYPSHLVKPLKLADGADITIRPIRPEDAAIEQAFVRNLSHESRYFRFMDTLRELSPRMLSHFTQVDYDRHMALIAVTQDAGKEIEIAVARYVIANDGKSGEFAIAVADQWQRKGVGRLLMRALMDAARSRGLVTLFGEVLASNPNMLRFMHQLGFASAHDQSDPRLMRVEIQL